MARGRQIHGLGQRVKPTPPELATKRVEVLRKPGRLPGTSIHAGAERQRVLRACARRPTGLTPRLTRAACVAHS
eukprot:6192842-Pyramimonas_sp.AAC.1